MTPSLASTERMVSGLSVAILILYPSTPSWVWNLLAFIPMHGLTPAYPKNPVVKTVATAAAVAISAINISTIHLRSLDNLECSATPKGAGIRVTVGETATYQGGQ